MIKHSFKASDVQFLLHQVKPEYLCIEQKEAAIQRGVHYSQILSKEKAPKAEYLALFEQQVERCSHELAQHLVRLAGLIALNRTNPVLVSLVRAGTPVGVALKRILNKAGFDAPHYSVSIVRDRGLDLQAVTTILEHGHSAEDIVFVDGWTGKGVIRNELSSSIARLTQAYPALRDELYVVSDIAGKADFAATRDDILIPSCILNATVSGLISRSVTRDEQGVLAHGAAYLEELQAYDRSQYFVDAILDKVGEIDLQILREHGTIALHQAMPAKIAECQMSNLLELLKIRLKITNINMIKPGIGEASRVLLRRVPDRLLVNSLLDPAVAHLVELAHERNVPIEVVDELPINAVAIIKDVSHE